MKDFSIFSDKNFEEDIFYRDLSDELNNCFGSSEHGDTTCQNVISKDPLKSWIPDCGRHAGTCLDEFLLIKFYQYIFVDVLCLVNRFLRYITIIHSFYLLFFIFFI